MTRNEIIDYMTSSKLERGHIQAFKDCINSPNIDEIDGWLKGVIHSLYYRPNKRLLVIVGEHPELMRYILPKPYSRTLSQRLLIDNSKAQFSAAMKAVQDTGFTIKKDTEFSLPITDKRMHSYYVVQAKWDFAPRNSIIDVVVHSVDYQMFSKIDLNLLWREIFEAFPLT